MREFSITRGFIQQACKVVVYGSEGVGKSTLAASFPDPVFIDTEGSTTRLDVKRLPNPESWRMALEEITYVASHPEICRTLVIDTLDSLETLACTEICQRRGWASVDEPGFGTGTGELKTYFVTLTELLDRVINAGITVVLLAHVKTRTAATPDMLSGYDKFEINLYTKVGDLIKAWADLLIFARFKPHVVNVDSRGKVHEGESTAVRAKNRADRLERIMYTEKGPTWDAKNRFGLAPELPVSYSSIQAVIEGCQPPAPQPAPQPKPADRWQALQADMSQGLISEYQARDILDKLGRLGKGPDVVQEMFNIGSINDLSSIAATALSVSLDRALEKTA